MSNIEPTEEQKQAASTHIDKWQWWDSFNQSEALARLLAEREAKLRAELSEANAEVNALRKSMMQADACIENFIANEDKADALLKRAGLDDTVNVVPRLAALVDETVALRARVAELEAKWGRAVLALNEERAVCAANTERSEAREAQHLADIKALMRSCCVAMDAIDDGGIRDATHAKAKTEYARLAHYDDAKAAEGGER